MRKLPTILAGVFIAITLYRVNNYGERMGGGWTSLFFAVALGLGVFTAAYWTRDSITVKDGKEDARSKNVKAWAWALLGVFVLADGLYNIAEVWETVKPPVNPVTLLTVTTIVFGAFPTLASAGLAAIQGHIDRLPKPPVSDRSNVWLALKRRIVSKLDIDKDVTPAPVTVTTSANEVTTQKPVKPVKKVAAKKATYEDYVSANRARNGSGPMTKAEIVTRFDVSTRTAHRWEKRYRGS